MRETRNILDVLKERGYVRQTAFEDELRELLGSESVTFYIGFDPTADSLHVGHLLQIIAMKRMQDAGHRPIALIGGGTAEIGDPSGRSDMRSLLTRDEIRANCEKCVMQIRRFLDFDGPNGAIVANNADWLLGLNHIDFMRDVGALFSVNRMLTAECFKQRLEKGLSFLEFNYMLLQSCDFLALYEKYGCRLQCGGDDQWSNILAGADLIRRKKGAQCYAMTFALLAKSDGTKMGKTRAGAIWLDADKTSPYEFFQYFRNVDDTDVETCLKLLTFLSLDEIRALCEFRDERINAAKERLAYETTKEVHGKDAADTALSQARSAFGGNCEEIPRIELDTDERNILALLCLTGLAKSKSDARRLIDGGGVRIDDAPVRDYGRDVSDAERENGFVLRKGKKTHFRITFAR